MTHKQTPNFHRVAAIALTLIVSGVAFPNTARGASFTDSFESGVLNPYWVQEGAGNAALTSAAAHSGLSSALLTAPPTHAELAHYYGSAQTGYVSVYMRPEHDSFGGGSALELFDANHNWLAVYQRASPGQYVARVLADSNNYAFAAADGWHELGLSVNAGGLQFFFDGIMIHSDSRVTSFSSLDLAVWAGGRAYFDDFSALTQDLASAPEPSTWLAGALGLAIVARRRCQIRTPTRQRP